jgi:hypothetical protein
MLASLGIPAPGYRGQTPAAASGPGSQPANAPAPSALLQPSLDALQQTIGSLQLEKWKKGAVREEAAANVSSIQRDLQSTLPALLKDADAAPESVSKQLPATRNIDALYDVVLRVVDAARVAAPGDQFSQLQGVMNGLEKARHAWNDQIEDVAARQEKKLGEVQSALKTQLAKPAPVCPAPPPPAPAPAKKPAAKKRKPATKPAATPPASNSQPAGAAKPNPSNP